MIVPSIPADTLASIYLYIPKVITATLCGTIIGIEREYKGKPAGLRTMILICVGCTLFTIISCNVSPSSDSSRVIAQIVTGIGFLGGGVIMKTDDKIIGVTTAAFIWVIAAIGMIIGLGQIIVPVIITIGLLIISIILTQFERKIRNKKT